MNKLRNIALLLAVLVSFQACTEVLEDVEPSTEITPELGLSDPGAVAAVRANMYSRLHGFAFTTDLMLASESLGDNLASRDGSSRFRGQFQNQVRAGVNDAAYGAAYLLINDANLLAEGIPDGVITDALRNQYRGEALVLRAFAHWVLVRGFGYEPGVEVNGFNLGVIIRNEPVLGLSDADFRARNTNAEVYAQMNADLAEAAGLLTNGGSRNFVTQAFAQGLHARINLYEGNFNGANTNATAALAGTSAALATTAQVATMFDETAFAVNPEAIFETLLANPAAEGQGVNSSLNAYTASQWVAQIPTPSVLALYDAADARNAWFSACDDNGTGPDTDDPAQAIAGCVGVNGGIELNKWNGELGQFADNIPLMRVSELLLIQSEARIRGSIADPLGPINTLRAQRGIAALGAVTLDDVLEERRRELIAEGHRFSDLKRLGRTITKDPALPTPDVPFNDFRILNDIPAGDIGDNALLVQNPGY